MACHHHVGDIGTAFGFNFKDCDGQIVPLASGTVVTAFFKDPDGEVDTYAGTVVGDGSAGQGQYVTTAADQLDKPGPWVRWARAVIPSLGTFTSSIVAFYVRDNEAGL